MSRYAAFALLTMGCASAPPSAPAGETAAACRGDGLQDLVGRTATSELAAEAQRRSGARTVRWMRPGQIVTMEFREDRLNIHVENGRTVRFNCG